MSSDYQFVNTDTNAMLAALILAYENLTKETLRPASPERIILLWAADAIIQAGSQTNYAANQNIPSRASGANLDALGELFYEKERPQAKAATCVMRFNISEAQASAVLIPAGTRVTDVDSTLYWETMTDLYVAIGETYADVTIICQTTGSAGNGYAAGQIKKLVDPFTYCDTCENITGSDGGADTATDAQYYQLLRESEDAYSTAGPAGGYVYWTKSVSTEIADAIAIMPKDPDTGELMAGHVNIFAVMRDGTIASENMKEQILEKCNDKEVRPLTDFVSVHDPGVINYNITFKYYIPTDTKISGAEIEAAVEKAVDDFVIWQHEKLGRDINPSELISLLMDTGIKRVELTEPEFTVLSDGTENLAPEFAKVGTINITNGGYEDE